MEENKEQLEEQADEIRQGSGSLLAEARQRQDKTIEEIAAELNLYVTQIKTIELDQTDGLPGPTYVRGYIRSYAKLLGLNPEEVLLNYLNPDWQSSSSLNDIPRGISRGDEASTNGASMLKIVVFLVLALSLFGLWYSGLLSTMFSSASSSQPSSMVSAVESADESNSPSEVAAPGLGAVVAPDTNPSSSSELEDEAADLIAQRQDIGVIAQDSAEQGDLPALESEQTQSENILKLDFRETSWVDIRDAEDARLAYKSYAQGDTLEIRESGEIQVLIGNATGVDVALNGLDFDLSDYREGAYAKFVIDASSSQ